MNRSRKTQLIVLVLIFIIISATLTTIYYTTDIFQPKTTEIKPTIIIPKDAHTINLTYTFSPPIITKNNDLTMLSIPETNLNSMGDGRPVIPVKTTTHIFPLGTQIIDIIYDHSPPTTIPIDTIVSYASCSTITKEDPNIYQQNTSYPSKTITYTTGGGLYKNNYQTLLNIRINPLLYYPMKNELTFTNHINLTIIYKEPDTPPFQENDEFDLLIITPQEFTRNLQRLITHKNQHNIRTKVLTVEKITQEQNGRDIPEKIKYAIKQTIEESGITSVLLIGGMDGQSTNWNLPPRYSHVIIREGTQEIIEPQFLSDLYYADIYDSMGNFSSWDTNNNDIFAEFDQDTIDEMDLYPDVYLGRLPCRNKLEVRIIVNKIIDYETAQNTNWFKRILLISGDHWDDENHIAEGIEIMEEAQNIMDGFQAVKLYATENNDLKVRDINKAISQGAGFAYFCGHGSPIAWGIHYPPDAKGWAPSILGLDFYRPFYMKFLRNQEKLPVTLVGGCNNGQFDRSIGKSLSKGKLTINTGCWAWKLTLHRRGGAIATIANTGLGTHAMDDSDNNGVNDYLEAYDGWMELRFLELYAEEDMRVLGQLHQETITQYLNRFLGNYDEMDPKMAQQWELFGDPSLLLY